MYNPIAISVAPKAYTIPPSINESIPQINNTKDNAQHLTVTLQGFKSHFWKADIWYDLKSKDLLKYVSDEGPGATLRQWRA